MPFYFLTHKSFGRLPVVYRIKKKTGPTSKYRNLELEFYRTPTRLQHFQQIWVYFLPALDIGAAKRKIFRELLESQLPGDAHED